MADRVLPGPVDSAACVKEAVCVHTRKIFDSCRDSDCIEDLVVFPTEASLPALLSASGVRPRRSELLRVTMQVDEISFNRGFYTVDVRYYYRIRGEACPSTLPVEGLAIFDKRVILFGSEGGAKQFSSDDCPGREWGCREEKSLPVAVVNAVDPIALRMSLADCAAVPAQEIMTTEIPGCIACCFDSPIQLGSIPHIWLVSLGQFSIIRLERDVQLLIPSYDYCMPDKECVGSSEDDPCTLFGRIRFPVEEFYPPDECAGCDCSSYRDISKAINEA